MGSALALATAAAELAPVMIRAGRTVADIIAMLTKTNAVLEAAQAESRDPTDAEWAVFTAERDAVHRAIQAA